MVIQKKGKGISNKKNSIESIQVTLKVVEEKKKVNVSEIWISI